MDKVKEFKYPDAPKDLNITTIFIGGTNDDFDQILSEFETYGKV